MENFGSQLFYNKFTYVGQISAFEKTKHFWRNVHKCSLQFNSSLTWPQSSATSQTLPDCSLAFSTSVTILFYFPGAIAVYLVTAFVPSLTACLANSPGRIKRTAVWISRDDIVERLLYLPSLDASIAILSKRSLTNESMMLMALLEMPVSGWTCFRTLYTYRT